MDTQVLTVALLLRKYLDWCPKHRAPRTHEWYGHQLQRFLAHLGAGADTPAAELRPFHLVEWVDHHPTWGDTYRRGAILAVQRAFNWAVELGYVAASPVKNLKKPPARRREQVVTPEEWAAIRDHYANGDPFRDILEFCWESGCRPQEAKSAEARHVQLDQSRIAFPPAEAKGKRRWRIIYLTPRAEQIIRRLKTRHPEGALFRNEDGRPWTAQAMACRFRRLKKRLGVQYATYSLRHGFCQRLLESGVDHLTVAELMGHANGQMVASVYSHLHRASDHLREALQKSSS